MHAIIGKKLRQTQLFFTDGTRMPVTIIEATPNTVTDIKTQDKHGYWAAQLGFGAKKRATKAELGHVQKGAKLEKAPSFLKEIRFADMPDVELGAQVTASLVVEAGDVVDATGTSKGKGFAGGVRRWNFRGGPRTHGQSDRERAPGSIGAGTTPGRVFKNKHMAGKMGNDQVTIKNLMILDVAGDIITVSGVVPGKINGIVTIKTTGKKVKKVPEIAGLIPVEETPVVEETLEATEAPVEEDIEAKTEPEVAPAAEVAEVQPVKEEAASDIAHKETAEGSKEEEAQA